MKQVKRKDETIGEAQGSASGAKSKFARKALLDEPAAIPKELQALLDRLGDKRKEYPGDITREYAEEDKFVEKIAAFGEIAVKPLIAKLCSKDWRVMSRASRALEKIGKAALKELLAAVADRSQPEEVRFRAAEIAIGASSKAVPAEIDQLVSDKSESLALRIEVAGKLQFHGTRLKAGKRMTGVIADKSEDLKLRRKLADTMKSRGRGQDVENLALVLMDSGEDMELRIFCAKALGNIKGEKAAEALAETMRSGEADPCLRLWLAKMRRQAGKAEDAVLELVREAVSKQGSGKIALLVEDDLKPQLEISSAMLARGKYDAVVVVDTLEEALAAVEIIGGRLGCVVTDLGYPETPRHEPHQYDQSGLELIRRLRAGGFEGLVVAQTGGGALREARECGANLAFSKSDIVKEINWAI